MMTKQPSSRYCFLCGRQNPVGLKMDWYSDFQNNQIEGTVTVPEHFNGYPGVVHGGIVTAILDETAGRAVLLSGNHDNLMVTVKLDMTFRQPTPTGTPLRAIGKVIRETPGRASVEGRLLLPDGTMTASCSAIVMKPPKKITSAWEKEREFWKVY